MKQKASNSSKEAVLTSQMDFEKIKKMFQNSFGQDFKKRFTVKIGQHLKVISTDEIECFFSENKATYCYTIEKRSFLLDNSLEIWQEQLDPEQFFRVNRTFIVNINAIKDIIAYSNSRLKLILQSYSQTEIIVSRERVKDFKSWIE